MERSMNDRTDERSKVRHATMKNQCGVSGLSLKFVRRGGAFNFEV